MKIYNKKFKYYKNKNLYPKINIKLKEYYNAFSIIFVNKINKFYY